MPLNLQRLNPQFLGLAANAAGNGNPNNLADILARFGGEPPTSIAAAPASFPVPPRGGDVPQGAGTGGAGVLGGAGRPSPVPAITQAAPQALGAAAAPGGGILGALSGLLGGGAGGATAPNPGSSAGPALPGGLPDGSSAGGGVSPLEALVPPTAGVAPPAPRAIRPGLGGQINPQVMQLILQALGAGAQPQQPAQSLGAILSQLR